MEIGNGRGPELVGRVSPFLLPIGMREIEQTRYFPPFPFFHVFQLSEDMLYILQVLKWQNNKDLRWVAIFISLGAKVAFE